MQEAGNLQAKDWPRRDPSIPAFPEGTSPDYWHLIFDFHHPQLSALTMLVG